MAASEISFKPALIVVDMQNDFCPPNGSLAVPGARDMAGLINELIDLPGFAVRVVTKDWHPISHVSFAPNHTAPDNKPFDSYVDVYNWVGGKPEQSMKQRLWPVHCVQDTVGAEVIDEISANKFDLVVKKGMDERVEMYSVFADSFGNVTAGTGGVSIDLASTLKEKAVSDVYVVGVAGDFCVKATAIDAAKAGFKSHVIEEATKCVAREDWAAAKKDLRDNNVMVVSVNGEEVNKVRTIAKNQ